MSRHRQQRRRTPMRPSVDRPTAAVLLRAARRADAADDAIEWAFTVMADRNPVRRLRIKQLLAHEDFEAADTLIAQGLRRRPTDASLSLLRARSLYAQDRLEPAGRELRLVLARRPHHRGALELAGTVAIRLGQPRQAVKLFQRAQGRRSDDRIGELIAGAWIDAGQPRRARQVIERMSAPSVLLTSRLLVAEGRLLEAAEVLDRVRADVSRPDHDAIVCELIDVLEARGDLSRLRQILVGLSTDRPTVLAKAGLAWLSMGAFHTAAVRMADLAADSKHRIHAMTVLMVAAAMLNRPSLARRALGRLSRLDEPIEKASMAEAWCRGLFGRLLLDQCSARKAGADPHTGRLGRLLGEAAGVFHDELSKDDPSLAPAERRDLQHHLTICEEVSGYRQDVGDIPAAPLMATAA